MNAKLTLSTLGIYLLAGTLAAAATARHSWFEAHTAGAQVLTLRGAAEFGRVEEVSGNAGPEAFVITLGAQSPTGAVLFTSRTGARPEPGTYPLGPEGSEAIQALVVTGSPTRPTGAYRARGGTLTVTRSGRDRIEGRFDLQAVGFQASDPADEARELVVRGTFVAAAGR